uniref:POU domain, class 5, transcription factor 3 n=1 Tax=Cyprinus carpio TaxID=7962 RepID=A0A8C2BEX9_CYPCA
MTERPQSPTGSDCRPYEINRAMYPQASGLDGLGGASLQFAHGMFQDPSLLFNKGHFNGISRPATHQTFFPFSGDFKTNDLQGSDFAQPKHWYPFAAPEFTGQVAGATAATQPANISPPIAETREQIKIQAEVKTEKDVDEYANEENRPTSQYNLTPGTSSVPTGVNYYTPWNPSFWPGLSHITAPANISQAPPTPSASSPSLSPSPPGNGFESPGFFNGGSAQNIPSGQAQSAARSSGSSSGGCSDSEEEVRILLQKIWNSFLSQTTICRFEPLLQRWLNEAENSENPQDMYKIERVFIDTRKRKRRTSLEGTVRSALESYFVKCPKPNTLEITHISDDLGLERDVVRVWFCNRRQKGKRLALPFDDECAEAQYYEQSPPPPPHMGGTGLPGQGYPGPAHPGGAPALYMPSLHRPEVFKNVLHPGLVGHLTS